MNKGHGQVIQNATPIRVLVVDDSAFMRSAIGEMLAKDRGVRVVAMAKNGIEAVKMAQQFEPDVITLDIEMPEMDGLRQGKTKQGPFGLEYAEHEWDGISQGFSC